MSPRSLRAGLQAVLVATLLVAASASLAQAPAVNPRSMIKLQTKGASGPPTAIADLAWLEGH